MDIKLRMQLLKVALAVVGVIFIFGIYTLGQVWPSGWVWAAGHPQHYLHMIIAVYAVLGVFLLIASRDPLKHLSLIWFTVWSSIAHSALMAYQSVMDPAESGHMIGDVPALAIIAIVLAILTPRKA